MKYYNAEGAERIGYDFYCDVAEKIVEARKDKGWRQEDLARESGLPLSKIKALEGVRIRVTLPYVETLSKTLGVSVDWLICAQLDHHGKDCLYLVWGESVPDMKFYQRASSSRLAFLKMGEKFKEWGVRFLEPRERANVRLVGVPVEKAEVQLHFPKQSGEDDPIEPEVGPR